MSSQRSVVAEIRFLLWCKPGIGRSCGLEVRPHERMVHGARLPERFSFSRVSVIGIREGLEKAGWVLVEAYEIEPLPNVPRAGLIILVYRAFGEPLRLSAAARDEIFVKRTGEVPYQRVVIDPYNRGVERIHSITCANLRLPGIEPHGRLVMPEPGTYRVEWNP